MKKKTDNEDVCEYFSRNKGKYSGMVPHRNTVCVTASFSGVTV